MYLALDQADNNDETHLNSLKKNTRFPEKLELKYGVQVMLLVNKDVLNQLINGSKGKYFIEYRHNQAAYYDWY